MRRPRPLSSVLIPSLVLVAGSHLLPAGGIEAQSLRETGQDPPVLVVNGTARVDAPPDRARIAFAVETEGETAREAGEANARLMDEVVTALQASQVAGLRVETTGYVLTPRYRTAESGRVREIAGYTARNLVQVIVDDVDAVGGLVDSALDAGANRVAGLNFEIQDPEPHRREALQQAVARARAEAEVIAAALGVRLGSPQHVQGGAEVPFRRESMIRADAMAMAAEAPTTPVEAGLQSISANVTIRFLIHDDG